MQLVILVGLQGSGKSTFAGMRFGDTHVYVSKDLMRNNRRPGRRQRQLIEQALAESKSVVVDNTNATREERQELIELGHAFAAEVVGYYFQSQPADCLRRNRQRQGRDQVPDLAIYATIKRLRRPSLSEGFDRLAYVRLSEPGGFEELPWREETE